MSHKIHMRKPGSFFENCCGEEDSLYITNDLDVVTCGACVGRYAEFLRQIAVRKYRRNKPFVDKAYLAANKTRLAILKAESALRAVRLKHDRLLSSKWKRRFSFCENPPKTVNSPKLSRAVSSQYFLKSLSVNGF